MKRLIEILLGSFLFFHFSMIMFYIISDNPISAKHKKIIDGYIDPFFSQTWRMFAPNPVNSNQTLIFTYLIYSNGKSDTISRDATTSLTKEHIINTNFATGRISSFLYHNIIGLYKLKNALLDSIKKNETLNKDSVVKANFFSIRIEHSIYFKNLYIYSRRCFFAIHDSLQINSDSAFVRISIVDKEFPRFENKYADYYDEKNYETSTWNSRWQKIIDK